MSASSAPAMRAVAIQLADALDRYQNDFDVMLGACMDSTHYRKVTTELHDIRRMKGSLPELSEEMADVLIRHVEMMHAVWNVQLHPSQAHLCNLRSLRFRHRQAVDKMRQACIALNAGGR
jgi:hypothetical protein